MNNKNLPLISCLCVSQNRAHFLRAAIDSFLGQSYPNKELIIIGRTGDNHSAALVRSYPQYVKYFPVDKMPLGQLRNLSIEKSSGEYFCQWDDDDWYHKDRLTLQLEAALANGKMGSILTYFIMYNQLDQTAYLSLPWTWPQTILCHKNVYDNVVRYPSLDKSEDCSFVQRLYERNYLFPLVKPVLYIYRFHGSNTWEEGHFTELFGNSQQLSATFSTLIKQAFETTYSHENLSNELAKSSVIAEFDYLRVFVPKQQRVPTGL